MDFRERIDELTLKLPKAEKKRVIKRWKECAEKMSKDGQGQKILKERSAWLKKSIKKKKKRKKEK